ncbi:MAG: hypothetical protein Q4F17_08320 [Eubacteriales bacterium]|nr:hypothetical protein [Eubacteriales bacterium]
MNGKDIFIGLGHIDRKFVEEAEHGQFPRSKIHTLKRPLLLAAVIAMVLMLAGCAVVYAMGLQDLKLGDYETDAGNLAGFGETSYQAITFAGFQGSPAYQAAQEWFEFEESYQPGNTEEQEVHPTFPEEYHWYLVDSQEKKDALDGILAKYNLKLMGVPLEFGSTKAMCSALGIEQMLTTGSEATVKYGNGICWESGNFRLDFDVSLPEDSESEATNAWGVLHWNRKEVLDPQTFLVANMEDWKQWNYTTSSGNQVLMMRTEKEGEAAAWILCDRPEGILSVRIDNRVQITDRQMEQTADALDSSVQPRKVSREDVQSQPETPQEATQDGYTLVLKSVEMDGTQITVTIGVTAPEGEDISHDTRKGKSFRIAPENWNLPSNSDSGSVGVSEDGDGLDNTQDIVITAEIRDGAADTIWNLSLENLVNSFWWHPDAVEKVIAVGTWQFEIPIP